MNFRELANLLVDHSLSINDYFFCKYIQNNDYKLLHYYIEIFDKFYSKESIDKLIDRNYIIMKDISKGYIYQNLEVTDEFLTDFNDLSGLSSKKTGKVEEWFDEWYDIFPKGVKSGGYTVRSDKRGCLNKLKKFITEYPEFDKDIIIEATKMYVEESKKNKYQFMMLAHYFISKHKISNLAGYCELVLEKKTLPADSFKESGEDKDEVWNFLKDI